MSYLNNKYIIHNQNRVFHGVDFDQLNKGTPKMYDKNLLLNYDNNKLFDILKILKSDMRLNGFSKSEA